MSNRPASLQFDGISIDDIFDEQLMLLQSKGHWVEVMRYNTTGNFSAILTYVPTAGEKPEPVFHPRDFCNTVALQVWGCPDGQIRFQVAARHELIESLDVPHKDIDIARLNRIIHNFYGMAQKYTKREKVLQ